MKRRGQRNPVARSAVGTVWGTLGRMVIVALAVGVAAPAWAQYSIAWFTISGGGAMSTSGGPYILGGTIGQPIAGTASGGGYSLGGGFWRGGGTVVGVGDPGGEIVSAPLAFRLRAPAPNPLAQRTVLAFDLPRSGPIRLLAYDATGRLVRTIAEGSLPAGRHERVWDGTNDDRRPVSTGVYFLRLDAGGAQLVQKVAVIR